MFKKMDATIGSFKIKLFKAPAITNTPPPAPSPKKKKNNIEVRLDHFCPWLNKIDQDEMKAGVIVVPKPQDTRPVCSQHLLSKISS